jgi:heme a synthase
VSVRDLGGVSSTDPFRPSVYRAAMTVAIATFPLIWLGGLVTTHDAGMAVPDWPGTYGYNLFLYPLTTWIFGPFDLLVEHGHRQLASLVGLLAIWLCYVVVRKETRRWLRLSCYLLLAAIISQGLLGGVRVLLDARIVAMIHGCTGPLIFGLAVFIVTASSRTWMAAVPQYRGRWLPRLTIFLLICSILQLFIGAQLRHVQPAMSPTSFMSFVHLHLTMAVVLTAAIIWLAFHVRSKKYRNVDGIHVPANALLIILVLQVLLGCATWVTNYALPWQELSAWLANYAINGKGFSESMIVTGHQATGSLLIACSVWLCCRVLRCRARVEDRVTNKEKEMKPQAVELLDAVKQTSMAGSTSE